MQIIDEILQKQILGLIHTTISTSRNRDDLWKLADEIATEMSAWIQTNIMTTQNDVKIPGVTVSTKPSVPKPDIVTTTQKDLVVGCDNSGKPNYSDHIADAGKMIDPDQITPVWMSQNIDLAEYWVYDYSTPCTTLHGNCGGACAKTEIWLVHRHKYKLTIVDAEFASLDALHDFLDPRKELAQENKIQPLEQIDAELAGTEEKHREECRIAKKQSRFNQFLECHNQFHGDAAKIADAMGLSKQSVYSYKNKAKTMGLLK